MAADKGLFIDGQWVPGKGDNFTSQNPANNEVIWKGRAASNEDVDYAVISAQKAFHVWKEVPLPTRIKLLRTFANLLNSEKNNVAKAISLDTGKPMWESVEEVSAMIKKVDISIAAFEERASTSTRQVNEAISVTRFRPHGVAVILGPFNFPGHLPNGHIIPALLAGNTILFKSSELTPYVSEILFRIWAKVGLPPGTINLLQGGPDIGRQLALHSGINALFFTGSWKVGNWLLESFAKFPEKMLALEMGGNNPLIVGQISDVVAAAYLTIQSAYITSGQRCSCARRLIVPKGEIGDNFLNILKSMIQGIKIGKFDDAEPPFMGPVITAAAANSLMDRFQELVQKGALPIIPMRKMDLGEAFISPGLLDVTNVADRLDEELFGPLLQLIRVDDFKSAINEANNTSYGLSAGLLSDSREQYDDFIAGIKAGVINWNAPLTGASSLAPFGGLGKSGNHRPSGYLAVDYCSYPIASMERPVAKLPNKLAPGLDFKMSSNLL